MRLHRFLAVLVIALSFNVAASKDARAFFKCYEFLSAHDRNDELTTGIYQMVIRGWVRGLGSGVGYWWLKQEQADNKSLGIQTSSLYEMENEELYYTVVRDCKNEPSRDIDAILLRLNLRTDVRK